MSVQLLGRAFYSELPAHLKLTLLALADEAADDGTGICIGQRRLGRKVGSSERTVRANLGQLRRLGYVRRLPELHPRYRTDQYEILVVRLPDKGAEDVAGPPRQARPPSPSPADMPSPQAVSAPPPARSSGGAGAPAEVAAPTGKIFPPDRKPAAGRTGSPLPPTRKTYPELQAEPSDPDGSSGSAAALASRRDLIFETLAILDGFNFTDPTGRRPNDDERGKLNRATRLVRQSVGEDAQLLRAAIACWPEVMDEALCTARGVSTNIGRLIAAAEGRVFRGAQPSDHEALRRELVRVAAEAAEEDR